MLDTRQSNEELRPECGFRFFQYCLRLEPDVDENVKSSSKRSTFDTIYIFNYYTHLMMSDLIFSCWKKFAKADIVFTLQLFNIYFPVGFVSQM